MEYMIFSGHNGLSIRQFVTSRGFAASIEDDDLYVGTKEADELVDVGQAVILDGEVVTIGEAPMDGLAIRMVETRLGKVHSERAVGDSYIGQMEEPPPAAEG